MRASKLPVQLGVFTGNALLDGLACSRKGLDPALNRFHAPMVYHEDYSFADWPETHTFPMDKFEHLRRAVLCPAPHLPRPLVRQTEDLFRALDVPRLPREWFASPAGPIDKEFLSRFLEGALSREEARRIGFREQTSRPELIHRTLLEVGGTILAAQLALRYGIASNLAGGTHHAHSQMGAGYTILNDLAITANLLSDPQLLIPTDSASSSSSSLSPTAVGGVERVLVVDCDVHQGDGTAKFQQLHQEGRIYTLSLHCASNYPNPKAHSSMDVGVADKVGDDEYMELLEKSVNQAIADYDPHLVLYDAGVDVFEGDRLGRLRLTHEGIRRRDRWVLERCVSSDIPVAAVIGGGYDKDVQALARRHAIVHEECAYVWRKYQLWKRSNPS